MTKTKGQRLYEYKSPPYIRVVPTSVLPFPRAGDACMMKNEAHVPWNLRTQTCRDGWEKSAVGHNIFSGE